MNSTSSLVSINSIYSNTSSNYECFICNENREEPIYNLLEYDVNRTCHCSALIHPSCYSLWFAKHLQCPICRNPILVEDINDNDNDNDNVNINNNIYNTEDENMLLVEQRAINILHPYNFARETHQVEAKCVMIEICMFSIIFIGVVGLIIFFSIHR